MNEGMDEDTDMHQPNRSWSTMDTQTERTRQDEVELDHPSSLQGTYFQHVSKTYPGHVLLKPVSIDVTEYNANEPFHLSGSFATKAGGSELRTYQVNLSPQIILISFTTEIITATCSSTPDKYMDTSRSIS